MQGQRASLGSLSDSLNFEHGSASSNAVIDQQIRWNNSIHELDGTELQDFMASPNNASTTISNSIYNEQLDLNRFCFGEASSSGTKNDVSSHEELKPELERESRSVVMNPLVLQSSNSNRACQNLNLNSDLIAHDENTHQVMGHQLLYDSDRPGNERVSPTMVFEDINGRPGSSSLEGRRASCKRKALEAGTGQPSSSSGSFHCGESSSWTAGPSYYDSGNSLNLPGSLEQGPRGLTPGSIPDFPVPLIAESSHRNFRVRINPSNHQETLNPSIFSAGNFVRCPMSLNLPHPSRILPAYQNPLELRPGPVLGNVVPQNPNASSAIQAPAIPRNMQPFRWNSGSNPLAGSSSSSVVSVDEDFTPREDIRSRSLSTNILDNPLFIIPGPEFRNPAHSPMNTNLPGGNLNIPLNVGSRTSRIGSSTQSNPAWAPNHNNNPLHYQRFGELFRRSLLSSLGAEPGNQSGGYLQSSPVPPANPEEVLLPSGGANNRQGHNRNYARAALWSERHGDGVVGIPHSLRVLASASRGRSRLVASEIRNVLDLMRRGENLRIEDIMLLDQSVFLGMADIHDRYRDMRLDVDNMSYEELLALEERIGDVCIGLSEETISNRLKQRKHTSYNGSQQDAEPCCVCQEEYNDGEDLGTLECGHEFHKDCIAQWLKRKNLCPICKTTGLNTTEKPTG